MTTAAPRRPTRSTLVLSLVVVALLSSGFVAWRGGHGGATGLVLPAHAACVDVGYLCVDLAADGALDIRRWKDFEDTLVVHVPAATFLSTRDARELQRAAAEGIGLWNGHPFPVVVDERGDRASHFSVHWGRDFPGRQIGNVRTSWSAEDGLEIRRLGLLATRHHYLGARTVDPGRVRTVAAHEMGHALGLGMHSDAREDVMYATSKATSLSARDLRTITALYALEDGTRIVR